MSRYKVITTITWEMESDAPFAVNLDTARTQLSSILKADPSSLDLEKLFVSVEMATMSERKKYITRLASYDASEILCFVGEDEERKTFVVGENSYAVKLNSTRLRLFKHSRQCVVCGLEGLKMVLEAPGNGDPPHFNLYAEENGKPILMTKDHIIPRSKGGHDALSNLQVQCCICNGLKANYELTNQEVLELRRVHANQDFMTWRERQEKIAEMRTQFMERRKVVEGGTCTKN
jgi:hypothetical protein